MPEADRRGAARPTYPRQLYEFIFAYHGRDARARWGTALDLGCGPGQATLELTPFAHVVGADPSPGMLAQARAALRARPELDAPGRFRFVQSAAEELGWLADGSVDMVVSGACPLLSVRMVSEVLTPAAAQAAHWFDWGKLWPEAARVLKPGGSLASWVRAPALLAPYVCAHARTDRPHRRRATRSSACRATPR